MELLNMRMQFMGAVMGVSLGLLASPAFAITGAQLRADNGSELAQGYVFGVMATYIHFVADKDTKRCVETARFTEVTIEQAVTAYIDRTPSALPRDAIYAVINTLGEICPN